MTSQIMMLKQQNEALGVLEKEMNSIKMMNHDLKQSLENVKKQLEMCQKEAVNTVSKVTESNKIC